jgi:hypothetical protein
MALETGTRAYSKAWHAGEKVLEADMRCCMNEQMLWETQACSCAFLGKSSLAFLVSVSSSVKGERGELIFEVSWL